VLVDGVRMDEIVEGTVGTLHILAREAQSRSSIRALKCMQLFVQVRLTVMFCYFTLKSCLDVHQSVLVNEVKLIWT